MELLHGASAFWHVSGVCGRVFEARVRRVGCLLLVVRICVICALHFLVTVVLGTCLWVVCIVWVVC